MQIVQLPDIDYQQEINLILLQRTSTRSFLPKPLTQEQMSNLLWACQGKNEHNRRTSPSAGALYPLEIYWIDGNYFAHYNPGSHQLEILMRRDTREELARAALRQDFIQEAPATILICAVYQRVTRKYGEQRGVRYVDMEAGHAAQNVLLQATAEGLGSVPVGAFRDAEISTLLRLPTDHAPLYLLPVGYPVND
jgi:SagB-type dehydrogenase family enzyme